MDIVSLTKKLLTFNTVNPPGNEAGISKFVGGILCGNGFNVKYPEFAEDRLNLIAEKGLSAQRPPIVFSGHFDTVPRGNKSWSVDPFAGIVSDGKIWGRGSSDMKGGLAAMIVASIEAFEEAPPEGGIRLIFSAAEEPGCQGVLKLAEENRDLGEATAILVGEPTSNQPVIGHKGALYLKATSLGKSAHSSMPELGENAIYKAVRSIMKIMDFSFEAELDPLLGYPTLNVGKINGGMNINSVPDLAEFTIDIRSTTTTDHNMLLHRLSEEIGDETSFEKLVDLNPVFTPENDPFVLLVYDVCNFSKAWKENPGTLPFLTDGAVLQRFYNNVPTVILGPGQPEMAHQTDEFCYINKLEEVVSIYKNIILKWSQIYV